MKTKYSAIFFIVILFYAGANAQTKFSRTFWYDLEIGSLNAITQTTDGGYVLAGAVRDASPGTLTDIFLVKFNSIGDTVWTQRIGASGTEAAASIQQTSDGGFIIGGKTNSFGAGDYDMVLVKTDSSGNVQWSKTYGTANGDNFFSVRQNTDGGYIISGALGLIRTDAGGDTIWTKRLNAFNGYMGYHAEQTPDGGFVTVGDVYNFSWNSYQAIIKLSAAGDTVWTNAVNINNVAMDANTYVRPTLDGGYVVVESNYSTVYFSKYDAAGNYSSGRSYAFTFWGTNYLETHSIYQLPDSNYLLCASIGWPVGAETVVMKLNTAGDTLWTKFLDLGLSSVTFTSDGGIAGGLYDIVNAQNAAGIHKLDSSFYSECIAPTPTPLIYVGGPGGNTNAAISITSGGITVTTTGLTNQSYTTRRLYSPCMPDVPVCMVTVDSATQNNLVVWEENFDTSFVDSYNVYKETSSAGNYALIGNVSDIQLSTFLDVNSNPAVQPDRYRVSPVWNTFYEKPNTSSGHKTIHLTTNLGVPPNINLIWSSYSGFSYSTYNIWRGNGSSVSIIASVPYGTNSYTDLSPPAGDSLYFIEIVHSPCNPTTIHPHPDDNGDETTRDATSLITGTRSNIVNRYIPAGIMENEIEGLLSLFPNPVTNQLTVQGSGAISNIRIYDVLGQNVYSQSEPVDTQVTIDVSKLNTGIYFLQVHNGQRDHTVKITKQ